MNRDDGNMQDATSILLVLCLMGAACTQTAAQASDPNQQSAIRNRPSGEIIKSIEFEGNQRFKSHVLRERLGFELGDRLDPFLAEGGRMTIAEVYRKVGYPSVKVVLDRDRLADGHLLYRIEEGPRVQIGSIEFEGNDAFGDGTLRQVIKIKEKKWLLWPFHFTEEAVEADVDRLREFYYGRGHLNYKIEARTELSDSGDKMDVVFVIEEGPVYRIDRIVFNGNTRFTEEQLRENLDSREGKVYLKAEADRGARKIEQRYREIGYVDAEVRQSVKFTPEVDENLVTLTIHVKEGRQFRIGRIDITGNETTKDKVVRRVLDEYDFTPGELYNAKIAPKEGNGRLEKYSQRAASAQQVMIRPVAPESGDPNTKDVRVDLEEGMTGLIRPGVGFSSDNGVMAQIIYQQQNFDIADLPEDLGEWFTPWRTFRGAGQRFGLRLEPGTRYSQYSISFSDPYWRDEPITFNMLGQSWKRFRESYDEKRLKGAIGFEQRLSEQWRRSIGFRAENVGVSDLDFDAPLEIRDFYGDTQLFGVRFGVGFSGVDDVYDPSQGRNISAFYEQVTGDDTFGILEGSYTRYFTLYEDVLGRKTILAGKFLGGTILGEAPPFEKFYAGGTSRYGIRGFEYRGVSTRGLQTHVPNPVRKDPVGSDWIFLAGAEITIPLVGENFGLLLFSDSGTIDTGSYRLSIGTGVEIKVPQVFGNMPIRFEIATPVLKDDEDETQVFSFSGGGVF
ncbi:MAG TPA: POTRA domain-containing protein [Sedimentisphaerales bacterium]|nr:POTRA domain-containing protein [Sedimentisphaerales bacterium]HQI26632.1 POTRA domain-containing protein [Sedimentisphaerales bacterium]